MSARASTRVSTAYEITLSSGVWNAEGITEEDYQGRIGLLQQKYTVLVLSTTMENKDIFDQNIQWMGQENYFKKPLIERWLREGLVLWFEFTSKKLLNWCYFMNESLINALSISLQVYYNFIREIHRVRPGLEDREQGYLKYVLIDVIANFFDRYQEERTLNFGRQHNMGLAVFTSLNVREIKKGKKTVSVPGDVPYTSPKEFFTLIETNADEYSTMIQEGIDEQIRFDLTQPQIPYLDINFKERCQWLIRGRRLWNNIIKKRGVGMSDDWSIFMNAELLSQLYTGANSLIYMCNRFSIPGRERENFMPLFNKTLQEICHGYFFNKIISDGEKKWSVKYGLNGLYEKHFVPISNEVYKTIYSEDPDDPFYPSMSKTMQQERELAFVMGSHGRLNPSGSRRYFKEMDAHVQKLILDMSLGDPPHSSRRDEY